MFKVKNNRTGKFIKDAITGKIMLFDKETAKYMAKCAERDSVLSATAWNSTRKSTYSVVPA